MGGLKVKIFGFISIGLFFLVFQVSVLGNPDTLITQAKKNRDASATRAENKNYAPALSKLGKYLSAESGNWKDDRNRKTDFGDSNDLPAQGPLMLVAGTVAALADGLMAPANYIAKSALEQEARVDQFNYKLLNEATDFPHGDSSNLTNFLEQVGGGITKEDLAHKIIEFNELNQGKRVDLKSPSFKKLLKK